MLPQCADNIVKRIVAWVSAFNLNNLPQLGLECLCAFSLHLRFAEGLAQAIAAFAVKRFAHGMLQSETLAFFANVFRHFTQLGFMPPECLAGIAVAVSDDEMCMNMRGIGVDCKQHIIALAEKEFRGKVSCNFICLLMCQMVVVLRVK